MELGGNLPPDVERDGRRRPDAEKVLKAYNAMANAEEKRVLTGPGRVQQDAVKIVRHLTTLLINKIQQDFTAMRVDYKRFGSGSVYVNTMVDNLRLSKVKVDSGLFRSWREVGCEPMGKAHTAVPLESEESEHEESEREDSEGEDIEGEDSEGEAQGSQQSPVCLY